MDQRDEKRQLLPNVNLTTDTSEDMFDNEAI